MCSNRSGHTSAHASSGFAPFRSLLPKTRCIFLALALILFVLAPLPRLKNQTNNPFCKKKITHTKVARGVGPGGVLREPLRRPQALARALQPHRRARCPPRLSCEAAQSHRRFGARAAAQIAQRASALLLTCPLCPFNGLVSCRLWPFCPRRTRPRRTRPRFHLIAYPGRLFGSRAGRSVAAGFCAACWRGWRSRRKRAAGGARARGGCGWWRRRRAARGPLPGPGRPACAPCSSSKRQWAPL